MADTSRPASFGLALALLLAPLTGSGPATAGPDDAGIGLCHASQYVIAFALGRCAAEQDLPEASIDFEVLERLGYLGRGLFCPAPLGARGVQAMRDRDPMVRGNFLLRPGTREGVTCTVHGSAADALEDRSGSAWPRPAAPADLPQGTASFDGLVPEPRF